MINKARPTETITAMNPIDRLEAAIGILQAIYAAQGKTLHMQTVFGPSNLFTLAPLEHAINLLIDLLDEFDLEPLTN